MQTNRLKLIEENIPHKYNVKVHYIHSGNSHSRSKHRRFIDSTGHLQHSLYTTLAELIDRSTGQIVATGISYCCKDAPVRQLGRHIAVGRAFKQLPNNRTVTA